MLQSVKPIPLRFPKNLKLEDFICINGTTTVIAREETLKSMNWEQQHYALADNKLYMSSHDVFLTHFFFKY